MIARVKRSGARLNVDNREQSLVELQLIEGG